AIGCNAWNRHLQIEARYTTSAPLHLEHIELRDPPVGITVALGRGAHEATTVRHPVVFVDEGIRRRRKVQLPALRRHDRDPLFVELNTNVPRERRPSLECARTLLRGHGREYRHLAPVGRESRGPGNALDPGEDDKVWTSHDGELRLTFDRIGADE